MRIFLTCMKCFTETGKPSNEYSAAHLEDSGLYHMTCSAGHKTVTCLQQMRFEVLFELAVYALVDGYHREAVSSFTSALERVYEFYLQVRCLAAGVPDQEYASSWKRVAGQSERQLGAFVFAHTLVKKETPALLQDSDVQFRNAVIHRGKIPSRDEAIAYGQKVFDVIVGVLADLRRDASNEINVAVHRHIAKQRQSVTEPDVAFMSIGTLISLNRADRQPSLQEWIAMLQSQRERVRA